jgi:hypothetical protein
MLVRLTGDAADHMWQTSKSDAFLLSSEADFDLLTMPPPEQEYIYKFDTVLEL